MGADPAPLSCDYLAAKKFSPSTKASAPLRAEENRGYRVALQKLAEAAGESACLSPVTPYNRQRLFFPLCTDIFISACARKLA